MARLPLLCALVAGFVAPSAAQAASITAVPPSDAIEELRTEVHARGEGGTGGDAGSRVRLFAVPAPAGEPCPDPQGYRGNELTGSGSMTGAGSFDVGGATSFDQAGRYRLCAFVFETPDYASRVIASDTTKLFDVRRPRTAISVAGPSELVAGQTSTFSVTAASEGVARTAQAGLIREESGCPTTFYGIQEPTTRVSASGTANSGAISFDLHVPALTSGRYLVCGIVTAKGTTLEATAVPLHLVVRPPPCVPDGLRRVPEPTGASNVPIDAALRDVLRKVGCELGKLVSREDRATQPRDVLEISPRGTQPAGTAIDVVVSLGQLCRVPDVIGNTLTTARRRFAKSGCVLRYVQRVRRKGIKAGRVVQIRYAQGPESGRVFKPLRSPRPLRHGVKWRILVAGKPK